MQIFKKLKKIKGGDDRYGLTKTVKITDVKGYLQKEFDRAKDREEFIEKQREKIAELEQVSIKYDAMLVVQEKTQERIERQDALIKKLRDEVSKHKETEKALRAKITDIKINAEKKLKAKTAKAKK
jgi:hypothetical protein